VDAGVGVGIDVGAEEVFRAVVAFKGLQWVAGTCPTAPARRF
jgi:hypothetical protein